MQRNAIRWRFFFFCPMLASENRGNITSLVLNYAIHNASARSRGETENKKREISARIYYDETGKARFGSACVYVSVYR